MKERPLQTHSEASETAKHEKLFEKAHLLASSQVDEKETSADHVHEGLGAPH
jgi:hypothetical protein